MERYDVIVVGAGIAGLTAAAAAAADGGAHVALLEAHRPGGRAATTEHDGIRFNQGPHAVYRGGEGWHVLERLGVRLTGGPPAVDGGMVAVGDAMHPLPLGPVALARTPLLRPKSRLQLGRFMASLARLRPSALADRSVNQWFDELGLAADARGLLGMLVRVATYAADHDALPAEVAVQQVQLSSQFGVLYLDGGWDQMVQALAGKAERRGVTRVEHAPVVSVQPTDGGWAVHGADGSVRRARAVVLAAGGPAAAGALLPEVPVAWRAPGPDVTAGCLDLAVDRLPTPPVLFGVDEPLYLSTHCPPARLAPEGTVVVAVARYRRTGEAGDPAADRAQLEAFARRAGLDAGAAVRSRYLHRMTVLHGVPRVGEGLAGRPPVAVDGADGLFVAGDWVGPAGWMVDASLASGEAAGHLAAAAARPAPATRSALAR